MGQPIFRVGGIASGLDTESIINSLVAVERIPINRMAVQRAQVEAKNDAWTDISTQVSNLRTTVDELRFGGGLDAASATSSDPDSVAATVTGTATPSTLTFTVDQLAATHAVVMSTGFAESTSTVGAGTITLSVDGQNHDINVGASTTLEELASSIRNLGVGLDAAVLKVADGDHRLSIAAQSPGASSVFTVTNTGTTLGSEQILTQGSDAQVTVGEGVGAIAVTRSSNVISDLVTGVELQLQGTTASPVTITTQRDVEVIADNITAVFDAANGVLSEIDTQTAFDTTSNTGSPLTGDPMARTLDSRLNDALGQTIAELTGGLTGLSPMSYERTGQISVDRDALITALRDEYNTLSDTIAGAFSADDARITPISTTSATAPGSYDVTVTSGGTSPTVVGTTYAPSGAFEDFNLQYNGTNVLIGVGAGSTLASAVSQINTALTLAGLTEVVAAENGGAIEISTPGVTGAATTFVTWGDDVWGLNGTFVGTDSAGFLGGETATAVGNQYSSTSGNTNGLVVEVDLSSVDTSGGPVSVGNVLFAEGMLTTFDSLLDDVEGIDGLIARARDEHDLRISDITDQIAAMELRVDQREATLRRTYTAMEQALAQLQAGSSFLQGLQPPAAAGQ